MKRYAVLIITLFCVSAFAQELPKIAVYVTGDVADNEKKALGTRMLSRLVNSGHYTGIERSNSFLAEIEKEQAKQRSGAIDDNQISQLGRQFGVKFVCIADITPVLGEFQVSARIVNVETAVVVSIGEAFSPMKTTSDLANVSDKVVENMFSGKTTTTQKTIIEPIPQPAPEPELALAPAPEPIPEPPPAVVSQENTETVSQTQQAAPVQKVRKHDGYFAARYALPIFGMSSWGAINLEGGWIWGNGTFFGIDAIAGDAIADWGEKYHSGIAGVGFNLGGVYDLPIDNMKLVYGGAVGGWAVGERNSDPNYYKGSINFLAPFVKFRWKFVEISYKGLLGLYDNRTDIRTRDEENSSLKFGWNINQVMVGLYTETSKRVR